MFGVLGGRMNLLGDDIEDEWKGATGFGIILIDLLNKICYELILFVIVDFTESKDLIQQT